MQLKWVTICVLNQIRDEAEQIVKLDGSGVVSIRLATPFEQMRDYIAQLFAKIEFRRTKALNKR